MAKMKPKSEAEKAFETKLSELLTPAVGRVHPESEQTPTEVVMIPSEPLDMDSTERTFFQYGTYLELIGGDGPAERTQVFQFPRSHEMEKANV